jgi:hypothetical protein
LWFQPEELVDYKICVQAWIYEWQEGRPPCYSHPLTSIPMGRGPDCSKFGYFWNFPTTWREILPALQVWSPQFKSPSHQKKKKKMIRGKLLELGVLSVQCYVLMLHPNKKKRKRKLA